MKRIALIIVLAFIYKSAAAQQRLQIPLAITGYTPKYSNGSKEKFDEFPLFDLAEIKARKIHTAYIIYHPGSWADYDTLYNKMTNRDNTPPWCDTSHIYKFDDQGRIIQIAQLDRYPQIIYDYDSTGYNIAETKSYYTKDGKKKYTRREFPYKKQPDTASYVRVETKNEKTGTDSITTTIVFNKTLKASSTKFEKKILDTIQINICRYNAQKLLVELENIDFYDDVSLNNYHYRYGYDEQKRPIYFYDIKKGEYEKALYPPYGMLIEYFDARTNTLKDRFVYLIDIEDTLIRATSKAGQIVLTKLEKGSNLYKLKSVTSANEFPSIHYEEIVYK
jgi:hypothetical protein